MAKDALGHGSNGGNGTGKGRREYKPIPNHPYHQKSDTELRYIMKDASEAGKNAQGMGDERGSNKYADQVNDAATVLGYRTRAGVGPDNNDAAKALAGGGAKSAAVPTHDAFAGFEPGGRHGYNPQAVNDAIRASNRSGQRIGGREARLIHALMKGR